MNIAKGIAAVFTKTQSVSWPQGSDPVNGWYRNIVSVNGIPVGLFIFFGVAIVCAMILNKTKAGRYILCLGSNEEAVRLSGIVIEPTKRNGRKQPVHMQYLNHMNEFRRSIGEDFNKGGRPSAEQTVQQWQQKNPNGKKAQCIKETGLSKPTVYKWWDSEH